MGQVFARLDTCRFGNVSTRKIAIKMTSKEVIQLCLGGAFAVFQ